MPDLAKRDKAYMNYYVYILKSSVNDDIYIGSTENVNRRIAQHNSGKTKSTKGYRPWILLESQAFNARSEAVRQERFLKTHQQRAIIKKRYGAVAK